MKKLYTLFTLAFLVTSASLFSQAFCDSAAGNVIIYSNYDGGTLNINVDQNIPNLKIGIVSYEFCRVNIVGPYAGNVTAVRWAGYNGTNNHCNMSTPYTTSIAGVPNNVDTIIVMPPAAHPNPNGYSIIICNYSCSSTTNQGGCNTPDQIAHYFLTAFGGSLYYHHTQYGCWSGGYSVSNGGNCCINPLTTSITENSASTELTVTPNPSNGNFFVAMPYGISTGDIRVYNMLGEEIRSMKATASVNISLEGEAAGIYLVKMVTEKGIYSQRVVVAE
jgi:hypothetical protein